MSSRPWAKLKEQNVPQRYGLSQLVKMLLGKLDRYHGQYLTIKEARHQLRMTPGRRAALSDTIAKCAVKIQHEPGETNTCIELMALCNQILEISNRPDPPTSFPFLKLPAEIRAIILHLIIDDNYGWSRSLIPLEKKSGCNCPKMERWHIHHRGLASKLPKVFGLALGDEFFRIFYRKRIFGFGCCCELKYHLGQNLQLMRHVRHIKVHWCGVASAEAFKLLRSCEKLEALTITVSKATLTNLSERASQMRIFFPHGYRTLKIPDALGLDELMAIRGLKEVHVSHANAKHLTRLIEVERVRLGDLLCSLVKQPKEE